MTRSTKATLIKRRQSIIPGFGLTMGFTLSYLLLVVLIPLSGLFFMSAQLSFDEFWRQVFSPRVLAAFRVSFGIAFCAALICSFFGLITAWVLVRYRFWGRAIADAVIDLPFALPTAVAGIALATIYAPTGWIGGILDKIGIQLAFNPIGIAIALVFVGLPYPVRIVQSVLEDMEMQKDVEEAAASLGASRFQAFYRVILPTLSPALTTGFAMAFARGLGEYGSVIFIAGNIPFVSEIVPLLIVIELEEYNFLGAAAIASVMLVTSFVLLIAINLLQKWKRYR